MAYDPEYSNTGSPVEPVEIIRQSDRLRKKLKDRYDRGCSLIDDSKISEKRLQYVVKNCLIPYVRSIVESEGGRVVFKKKITLYEIVEKIQHKGYELKNDFKRYSFSPDGGIIFVVFEDREYPIFIGEDKLQGTNDSRFLEGKKKQALGNAIERASKNIRLAELLFSNMDIFPYIVFASGCDFHHTETIQGRLIQMNYLQEPHYIEITNDITEDLIEERLNDILLDINISKRTILLEKKYVASFFVKAHKWDEMPHLSSCWKIKEIEKVCLRIINKSLEEVFRLEEVFSLENQISSLSLKEDI